MGTTAHLKPTALTATGVWDGTSACTAAVASFVVKNKETVSEKVKFKGSEGLGKLTDTLSAGASTDVCVTSGYTGVITIKLSDGNTAAVTF